MKKHLALVCLAFLYLGIGITIRQFGRQAGLGIWPVLTVFTTSIIFYIVVMFTSMQEIREKLFKEDEIKFDFENEKTKT